MTRGDYRVNATMHAAERAVERVPRLKGFTPSNASRWLENLVADGLEAGRVAKRAPSWCSRAYRYGDARRARATGAEHLRYVWDEAETVAALVKRTRDLRTKRERVWLVVTVIGPPVG